ncbi:P-loop containing nucleoside triphosphate hydrolase protein [Mycena filopes]|nr:P-loop containing nucleoside triphosphate hydrolase protein [Mycena filopes]
MSPKSSPPPQRLPRPRPVKKRGPHFHYIQCTTIGDAGVGKTCMITAYAEKTFPVDYIPTIYGGFAEEVEVDGRPFNMGLVDTAAQSEYDHLRPLSYPQTDVFLLCFRVDSLASFDNVRTRWFPEAHHHCPDVPCIVVATQIDLRDEFEAGETPVDEKRGFAPLTTAQGETLAKELKAVRYVECSAKTQQGVRNVFEEACVAAIAPPSVKKRPQCIVV